jgi:hypothetical protein
MHDEGTHTIFVGRPIEATAGDAAPLVYCDAALQGLRPA